MIKETDTVIDAQNTAPRPSIIEKVQFLTVLLTCVLVVWNHWRWLTLQVYPEGYNGFYYLQEVSFRIQHGRGYYHSVSPFFSFMTFLSEATSPMGAYNLMALGSLLLFALSVGLTVALRSVWWLAPVACCLTLQSEPLFFAHYTYLKQASAMSLLAFAALLFEIAFRVQRWKTPLSALALISIALAGIFHQFAVVCGIVLLICMERTMLPRRLMYGVFSLLALLLLAYLLANPKPLHTYLQIRSSMAWDELALSQSKFQYRLYALTALVFVVVAAFMQRERFPWLVWILYFFLILPIWQKNAGYFHRFPLSSVWLFLIGCGLSQGLSGRRIEDSTFRCLLYACLLGSLIIGLKLPASSGPPGPSMSVETIANKREILQKWIPEDALVRAPHGVQFRVAYFLRRKSQQLDVPSKARAQFVLQALRPEGRDCKDVQELEHSNPEDIDCVKLDQRWFIWRESVEGRGF